MPITQRRIQGHGYLCVFQCLKSCRIQRYLGEVPQDAVGHAEPGSSACKLWITCRCLSEVGDRAPEARFPSLGKEVSPLEVQVVGRLAVRASACTRRVCGGLDAERRGKRSDYRFGEIILYLKDVACSALEAV